MQKRIACLDLDAFFVEAALLENPEFRGLPVVVGGIGNRGVVCSASYEARKFGITSAMPVWLAKNRCKDLRILPVPDNIGKLSRSVYQDLTEFCPVVEQASVDEFYLDFTGCDRIYRHNLDIAETIAVQLSRKYSLPSTVGIGTNKLLAKIATNLGKPRGILEVLPGHESAFLANLPIKEIPGIGKKMEPTLNSMGVFFVKDVLLLPIEAWIAAFGKTGEFIFNAAHGISTSQVVANENRPLRKGISRDSTLGEDTASRSELLSHLSRLVEKAVYQLQVEQLSCAGLTVKIKYADFITRSKSTRISRTNNEKDIFAAAVNLFSSLFSRRIRVRMVGVYLGAIQPGGITRDLWDLLLPEYKENLPEVIKIIRAKFGFDAILRSRSVTSRKGEAL
jgi:DNA polymerase-4